MRIEILGTGPALISMGLRGIEPVMEEILTDASTEIQILAYRFTPRAKHLLNLLGKAAQKGVRITMVVDSLTSQHRIISNELKSLKSRYPHFKVIDLDVQNRRLHAKLMIADRKRAVVGSANFSWGGMYANYEVGLLVEGDIAWKLAEVVDSLANTA